MNMNTNIWTVIRKYKYKYKYLSLKIDNGSNHTLTNYSCAKEGGKAVESDHKPLVMEVKIDIPAQRKEKIEIMNFKDKASQEVFKDITTKTRAFTQCFSTKLAVLEQAYMWLKLVKAHCRRASTKEN